MKGTSGRERARRRARNGREVIPSPGPSQSWLFTLILGSTLIACAVPGQGGSKAEGAAPRVRPGIEVLLSDSLDLVKGKRVGLITNTTGVFLGPPGQVAGTPRPLDHDIDTLFHSPDVDLVALFGPEHGLRQQAQEGVQVENSVDARTGLPVYSLYGKTLQPTPEMLRGIDVLLFDMQDVGARYFTYVSTMALAMKAAGAAGIPFVVLDRPNPLGGDVVQGDVLDTAYASFIGMYPVPMRHGMTVGELARMIRGEWGVKVDLHVVPAEGWRRDMRFEDTGLPWVPPSPNLPTLESVLLYPGTCLFEGTPLSVGRGTARPFQWVGAPWLDGAELARRLEARRIPGVRFEPATFVPHAPSDGKFDGQVVHGVRMVPTSQGFDPTRAAVAMLVEAYRMSGSHWKWNVAHFDELAGTDALRLGVQAGEDAGRLTAGWDRELTRFRALRRPYLLYR